MLGQASVPSLPLAQVLRDFRNPGAVLFSLLLFFQFGNEWSIAGWLPLFLIRRLGISPEDSLLMLALYWAGAAGGAHRLASDLEAREPGSAADRLDCFGAAGHASCWLPPIICFGAVMGILFVGAGYRFHLSAGGGEDRASVSLLPSGLLQRHLFARDDRRASWRLGRWAISRQPGAFRP